MKIVNSHLIPRCLPDPFPEHVGVGVKNPCEIAVHATRDVIDRHKHENSMVLVKVDLTNAFNMVERKIFLDYIHKHHPEVFNWINFCYGDPSVLDCEGHVIESSCGVQQGDPLGPLLFALALSSITRRIRNETSLDLNIWYCDDGTLMGKQQEVAKALQILEK